jgi:peptide/nickel transport system permease protein
MTRRTAGALVLAGAALAASGLLVSTAPPDRQHTDHVFAPPMRPHVRDAAGRWRAPFVYPIYLENRLERRYAEDRSRPLPLRWFRDGALVGIDPAAGHPWFVLGTDPLGRDVYARVASGARFSLGVALIAAAGSLLIGTAVGAVAGFTGGWVSSLFMRAADLVIALPILYVVLALRAALPLVLTTAQVFWVMVLVFAFVGWPLVARGVRSVVMVERAREYAESALALGASSTRILLRHLLPASAGVLIAQTTLLVPAFIMAEATLSYVGLGFSEPIPSWGLMLQDASRGRALVDAPWLLAPAAAIAGSILFVNAWIRTHPRTRQNPSHTS